MLLLGFGGGLLREDPEGAEADIKTTAPTPTITTTTTTCHPRNPHHRLTTDSPRHSLRRARTCRCGCVTFSLVGPPQPNIQHPTGNMQHSTNFAPPPPPYHHQPPHRSPAHPTTHPTHHPPNYPRHVLDRDRYGWHLHDALGRRKGGGGRILLWVHFDDPLQHRRSGR